MPRMQRGQTGLASLEGFDESLRLLVLDEQYSLTDIGMMFNVSRERIRQHCVKLGIPTPSVCNLVSGPTAHVVRVWDDDLNRFRPVRRLVLESRLLESLFKRDVRVDVRAGYAAHIVAAGQALTAKLDRPIKSGEWWKEASGRTEYDAKAHNAMLTIVRAAGYPTLRAVATKHGINLRGRGALKLALDNPLTP